MRSFICSTCYILNYIRAALHVLSLYNSIFALFQWVLTPTFTLLKFCILWFFWLPQFEKAIASHSCSLLLLIDLHFGIPQIHTDKSMVIEHSYSFQQGLLARMKGSAKGLRFPMVALWCNFDLVNSSYHSTEMTLVSLQCLLTINFICFVADLYMTTD